MFLKVNILKFTGVIRAFNTKTLREKSNPALRHENGLCIVPVSYLKLFTLLSHLNSLQHLLVFRHYKKNTGDKKTNRTF